MKRLDVFTTQVFIGGDGPRSPQEVAHEIALSHDLPEIPGYYGCDLTNGEFLSS